MSDGRSDILSVSEFGLHLLNCHTFCYCVRTRFLWWIIVQNRLGHQLPILVIYGVATSKKGKKSSEAIECLEPLVMQTAGNLGLISAGSYALTFSIREGLRFSMTRECVPYFVPETCME